MNEHFHKILVSISFPQTAVWTSQTADKKIIVMTTYLPIQSVPITINVCEFEFRQRPFLFDNKIQITWKKSKNPDFPVWHSEQLPILTPSKNLSNYFFNYLFICFSTEIYTENPYIATRHRYTRVYRIQTYTYYLTIFF